MSIILVERLQEDGSPRVNKPMWLAFVGEEMLPLSEVWKLYMRRFAVDHWYRFIKQRLHWTLPKLKPNLVYIKQEFMSRNTKVCLNHRQERTSGIRLIAVFS
ncbi:hypothetical protein NIES4075_73920 [Tolypothrix sp. NIES-4075]|uniref:hypothetical protein n=1 Tax=Tolypothrix sp. NIES-4075 TaxID=2005459 RepID=UPI000B5C4E31|nr:hypothetical protein [Tolypothrix sp. NIES-4075]GAX46368.1 hypothetical protein NIES4075_73920 [Tolypothrix sp. NIES-4075]